MNVNEAPALPEFRSVSCVKMLAAERQKPGEVVSVAQLPPFFQSDPADLDETLRVATIAPLSQQVANH